MGSVPLLVSAQLLRIVGYALALFGVDWVQLPALVSPTSFIGAAFMVETLGYLDLSFRTSGAAKVLLRLLVAAPLLYVAFAIAAGAGSVDSASMLASFVAWAYAADVIVGVIAMWLVARRMHAVAVAALVLAAFELIVPRFASEWVREMLAATGIAGEGLLVFGVPILIGVLALFAGKAAEPLSIDRARAGRTLRRAPLGIVFLAIWAIVEMSGNDDANVAAFFTFVGLGLLVIAAYRARSLRAAAAPIVVAYAMVNVLVALVGIVRDHGALPRSAHAAIVAAIAALVIVAVRAAPATRRIVAASIFGVLGVASFAMPSLPAVAACMLGAELAAIYVLRSAGRELAIVPETTVADVFA